MLTAQASQGRPEAQGRRDIRARVRARVPLFERTSFVIAMPNGRLVTLSFQWITRARWKRSVDALPESGWHTWNVCFIIVAFRVE